MVRPPALDLDFSADFSKVPPVMTTNPLRLLLSLFLFFCLPLRGAGQEEPPLESASLLGFRFDVQMAEIDKPLYELQAKYRDYLEKQKAAYEAEGNLQGVVAVENEMESFEDASTSALSPLPELKRLQEIYRQQSGDHEKNALESKLELVRSFSAKAGDTIEQFTRDGRIDDARSMLAESERFATLEARLSESSGTVEPGDIATLAPMDTPETPRPSSLALPADRQRIVEEGGAFHIWGIFDGEPLDEDLTRELGRLLRDRDYVKVAIGRATFEFGGLRKNTVEILAVRKDGSATVIRIPNLDFLEEEAEFGVWEWDDVPIIDYNGYSRLSYIAENAYCGNPLTESIGELSLDEDSFLAQGQDLFVIREAGGEFRALGGVKRFKAELGQLWDAECQILTSDRTRFLAIRQNEIFWINDRNEFRWRRFIEKENDFQSIELTEQPAEPITQLFGPGKLHGKWIAIGASGNVYADKLGGFAVPHAEWSPARDIRFPDVRNDTVLLQKPDGSWVAHGSDEELKAFLFQLGPAVDLDVCLVEEDGKVLHRIVTWAEPEDRLR